MVDFPKFKAFAGETKLHGVPRIAEGSKMSMVFWGVLVIICVGMAINDLYQLLTLYKSAPTAIQMDLVSLSTDFNWTTPTLCMEMIASYDTATAGQYYLDNSQLVVSVFPYVIKDFMERFYNTVSILNYTEILYPMAKQNLFYHPYMLLGNLAEFEQNLLGQPRLNNYQFSLGSNDPQVNKHLQIFYDEFYKQNASMETLTQLVGMWYCLLQLNANINNLNPDGYAQIYGHMENYRYFGDPAYIQLPMCKTNMITHLGFGIVCSKLFETPNVPLAPDYDHFAIYDTRMTRADTVSMGQSFVSTNPYAMLVPNLKFHLDLEGRNVIPAVDRTNVFSWNPGENVVLGISVATEYQFLNTRKQSCSTSTTSQAECVWQKRVEFVHQQCGCWPSIADIQNQRKGVNCTSNHLINIYNIDIHQFCPSINSSAPDLTECIMDCHLYNYSFTQFKSNVFPGQSRGWSTYGTTIGSLEFHFSSDRYNLITEYPTTDWTTFLGTWGGSIGTWLGASLLAFAHIPIYIFRQYCLPKSNVKPTESD